MNKKAKHDVHVKRSDKDLIDWRKDPFGKIQKMYKEHTAFFWIIILLIISVLGIILPFISWMSKNAQKTQNALDRIEVKLSADQAANMLLSDAKFPQTQYQTQATKIPVNDAEQDFDTYMSHEISMDPLEDDGMLLSGYVTVSFETDYGPCAIYDGYVEEGLFNGQGMYTMYYPGTNTVKSLYYGEWKNSLPNGVGTLKSFYEENSGLEFICSGTWVNGKMNGPSCKCTDLWPTGEIHIQYSGGLLDGKFSGIGDEYTEYSLTGAILLQYSGDFLDNKFNGNGKVLEYAEDGQVLNCVYEGTMKDHNRNGMGKAIRYYEDGKTIKYLFEGAWKDNCPEGQALVTEYYEDGKTVKWQHSGLWKGGFPESEGTFTKYDKKGGVLVTGTTESSTKSSTEYSTDEIELHLTVHYIPLTIDESILKEFDAFMFEIVKMVGYSRQVLKIEYY